MSLDLDEAELEFDRLSAGLDVQAALAFSQNRAAVLGLPLRRLIHLSTVGELAARYADVFFVDLDTIHRKYVRQACQAAGYAHETLAQGTTFEELTGVVDEAVARLVSAVTPDVRLPHPERVFALSNRVGLAEAGAQLVKFADLVSESQIQVEQVDSNPAGARDWVAEALAVLGCLKRITDSHLRSRVVELKTTVHALERRLRDLKQQEKLANGRRRSADRATA